MRREIQEPYLHDTIVQPDGFTDSEPGQGLPPLRDQSHTWTRHRLACLFCFPVPVPCAALDSASAVEFFSSVLGQTWPYPHFFLTPFPPLRALHFVSDVSPFGFGPIPQSHWSRGLADVSRVVNTHASHSQEPPHCQLPNFQAINFSDFRFSRIRLIALRVVLSASKPKPLAFISPAM